MSAPKNRVGWALREARVVYERAERHDLPRREIDSSADLVDLVHAKNSPLRRLVDSPEEHFIVLCLNTRNEPTGWYLAGKGGGATVAVDPASVLRAMLLQLADSAILLHNHPSANPTPSSDDIALTQRIVDGADLLGMRILDHVILTEDPLRWYSFRDAGVVFAMAPGSVVRLKHGR